MLMLISYLVVSTGVSGRYKRVFVFARNFSSTANKCGGRVDRA